MKKGYYSIGEFQGVITLSYIALLYGIIRNERGYMLTEMMESIMRFDSFIEQWMFLIFQIL